MGNSLSVSSVDNLLTSLTGQDIDRSAIDPRQTDILGTGGRSQGDRISQRCRIYARWLLMAHEVIAMDRVDVDRGHVKAAERPNDHLQAKEEAKPLVSFSGNHMAAHQLMIAPPASLVAGRQATAGPFLLRMTEGISSRQSRPITFSSDQQCPAPERKSMPQGQVRPLQEARRLPSARPDGQLMWLSAYPSVRP